MKLTCTECSLSKVGCVSGSGATPADIMIVVDRPSLADINAGQAFTGKVGKQLREYLTISGIPEEQVYFTHVVKGYVKPGKNISIVSIRKCVDQLKQELEVVKPKVLILMGAAAYKAVRGKSAPGTAYFDDELNCWVVYTFHPLKPMISGQDADFSAILASFTQAKGLITKAKGTKLDPPTITIVKTQEELLAVLPTLVQQQILGVDCETTGLNPYQDKLLTIGLSSGSVNVGVIFSPELAPTLAQILNSVKFLGHNVKFDLQFLAANGIKVKAPYMDTMLGSYVLEPLAASRDLASQCLKEFQTSFDKNIDYPALYAAGITPEILTMLAERGTLDAFLTYKLMGVQLARVSPTQEKFLFQVVMPICGLLTEIETNGLRIDKNELFSTSTVVEYKLKSLVSDIQAMPEVQAFAKKKGLAEINFGSPKQMSELIYKHLKITPDKEEGETTKKEVLEKLGKVQPNPVLEKLLEFRNVDKLYDTYIKGIQAALSRSPNDRIHVNYSQDRVVTGRLSCSAPNLQTIPNKKSVDNADLIRKMFCAEDGRTLVEMDFKQLEFRVWGHMSRDTVMLQMIQGGGDIHKKMAAKINGITEDQVSDEQRYQAKEISFGLMYGMGTSSLAARTKLTIEQATKIKEDFFTTFPDATVWLQQVADFGLTNQYVTTPFGRRIPIVYNPNDKEDISSAKRRAVNYPIQSTAAELTNIVGCIMFKKIEEQKTPARIVLNVHDSLVWEVEIGQEQAVKQVALQAIADVVNMLSFRAVLEASFKSGPNLAEQTEF